jgi:hypothetical protein
MAMSANKSINRLVIIIILSFIAANLHKIPLYGNKKPHNKLWKQHKRLISSLSKRD